MSLELLKKLQIVVGICVAGVAVALAMSIVTAIRAPKPPVKVNLNPATIPTPAAIPAHR